MSSDAELSISTVNVSILLVNALNAITAGTATKRPNAVVTSASAIPPATAAIPAVSSVFMPWNALMMPIVVPNSPTNGATDPIVARPPRPLQVFNANRRGAFESPLGRLDRFARNLFAPGMRLKFVQSGNENLGEVTLVVLFSESYRFVDLSFLEALRYGRRKDPGLLARGVVGDPALDHDAYRVSGHDAEDDHNPFGNRSHGRPQLDYVDSHLVSSLR